MTRVLAILSLCLVLATAALADQKKRFITVNLKDVELTNVVAFISEVTGKNFIYDDALKGKVTIIAPAKISADEAYSLFASVLGMKGYTLIPGPDNLLKIVPSSQARTQTSFDERSKVNDSYITKLIPLEHAAAETAIKSVQPLISKDGHISVFSGGNLLVVDSGLNIRRIEQLLEHLDQPFQKDEPELVVLQHAAAEDVAKTVADFLKEKSPQGQADDVKVAVDSRLNALVVLAPSHVKEWIRKLVKLVDVPQKDVRGAVNVYFLENAEATELAKVLDSVVKSMDESSKQPSPGASQQQAGRNKVTITADKATNALIINAPPGAYENLLAIVKSLDKRRRQVYVEAMIVEASIDGLKELGAKWRATVQRNGEPVVIGGFGKMDQNALLDVVNGLSGFSAGGAGNFLSIPVSSVGSTGITTNNLTIPGFAALFNMNEFKDIVNILSSPQLLTSDNKKASIIVGENIPIITKKEQNTSTNTSLFNTIERQDVGIKLELTPQITEGEYVKLDLKQEISAVKDENFAVTISNGPTTTKRATETSVAVKDRQTVVIGGLMQEKSEEIINKMPFFGDIPVLGFFFRTKSLNKKKTNLLVFLTPYIIRDSSELAALSGAKQKEFSSSMSSDFFSEYLLKTPEGTDEARLKEVLDDMGIAIKGKPGDRTYLIELPQDKGILDVRETLKKKGLFESVEPNFRVRKQQ